MSQFERSLYLYFLDRELGDAVGFQLDPEVARAAARTLVIATNSRLLCGLSLLYENTNLDRRSVDFIGSLVSAGILDTVSHYLSFDEFWASRVAMYQHDAGRYPAYFGQRPVPVIAPTIEKPGGTSGNISTGLRRWAAQIPGGYSGPELAPAKLREPVLEALREREGRAITYSLFQPFLGDLASDPSVRGHIRRAISRLFASDYSGFGDNDVPTGIRGLAYFEQFLAKEFPLHDVQILARLIRLTGLSRDPPHGASPAAWELFLYGRATESHRQYCAVLRWIISSAHAVASHPYPDLRHDEIRERIMSIFLRHCSPRTIPSALTSGEDLYAAAARNGHGLAAQLGNDPVLAAELDRRRADYFPPPRADVLLVVTTETEIEAVITTFSANGYGTADPVFSSTNAYHMFLPIGGARVALVRCSMGPGGPGGPALTVAEAISTLQPSSVIMLGIAFGIDPAGEKIGDVLLSTHVFDYGLERIGTDNKGHLVRTSRGTTPEASARLISRFRAARMHNHGLRVREGVLLSGNKLVDNSDYRGELHELCPDAIGGEMEGFGVYSAAERARIDWVIIKAVSDWADGTKRGGEADRQRRAARNAATAVLRTLENGGFG